MSPPRLILLHEERGGWGGGGEEGSKTGQAKVGGGWGGGKDAPIPGHGGDEENAIGASPPFSSPHLRGVPAAHAALGERTRRQGEQGEGGEGEGAHSVVGWERGEGKLVERKCAVVEKKKNTPSPCSFDQPSPPNEREKEKERAGLPASPPRAGQGGATT